MHSQNWDDLRFVLAVAEIGTVSGAARALGVNHATVLRRIAAFEERHGQPLFERTARGYVIPPEKLRVLQAARDVEAAVETVRQLMSDGRTSPTGLIRITSTDTLSLTVLPDILAELQRDLSGLQIELMTSNAHVDFSRLHAHITVRPAKVLPDDLTGEIAAQLGFGIFGPPRAEGWLRPTGPLTRSPAGQWMTEKVSPRDIRGSADSFVALAEMSRATGTRVLLPRILGAGRSELREFAWPEPLPQVPIWVASHSEIADSARYRAVRKALCAALARRKEVLGAA